jgi:uncharacterized membrane protein
MSKVSYFSYETEKSRCRKGSMNDQSMYHVSRAKLLVSFRDLGGGVEVRVDNSVKYLTVGAASATIHLWGIRLRLLCFNIVLLLQSRCVYWFLIYSKSLRLFVLRICRIGRSILDSNIINMKGINGWVIATNISCQSEQFLADYIQIYHAWEGYLRKIPVERRKISWAEWRRNLVSRLVFFASTPPRHDISV